jgi:hypothetical protein
MENYRMKRISLISLIFVGLLSACSGMAENTASREAAQERRVKAEAMFQERCKKSGVFIHRTAENVEGILLLKLRPDGINRGDQYKMNDPYGHAPFGDDYIKNFFLEPAFESNKYAKPDVIKEIHQKYHGYRYVDTIDPQDGRRYRYTGRTEEPWQKNKSYLKGYTRFVLDKTLAPDPAPRYGVTYEDISTRQERDYWIAGSSLKVIDLQTNEVIAERIGYMMDPGQGNRSGGRAPWLMAANYACPSFKPSGARVPGTTYQLGQTRNFVTKVLKPILEK